MTHDILPSMADRLAAAQAQKAIDVAQANLATIDQRITAQLNDLQAQLMQTNANIQDLAVAVHKLRERQDHADAWLHKLLNPNGDAVPAVNAPTLFDHEDGL